MSRRFWLESHSGNTYDLNISASFLHSFSSLGKSRIINTSQIGNWSKVIDDKEQFAPITIDAEIAFLQNQYTNLTAFLDFYHKDVRQSDDIEQRLKLYYQPEESDNPLYAYVDIEQKDYSKVSNGYQRIMVRFYMFSPWIQDTVYVLDNMTDIIVGDPYPYTYDLEYGDVRIDGELDEVFVNDGDDDAVYEIQIIGRTAYPTFTIGDRTISFNLILEENESIYINAAPNSSTIELDGVYNDQIFNPLNSSPWFTIPRGLVPIQIRATGGKFILTMKKVIIDARKI